MAVLLAAEGTVMAATLRPATLPRRACGRTQLARRPGLPLRDRKGPQLRDSAGFSPDFAGQQVAQSIL